MEFWLLDVALKLLGHPTGLGNKAQDDALIRWADGTQLCAGPMKQTIALTGISDQEAGRACCQSAWAHREQR